MTAYTHDGNFCRELFVSFHSKRVLQNKFVEFLINSELDLEIIQQSGDWWHFKQKNIKFSRKQVQPLFSTIVNDMSRL
jgi:hypothetical protein